MKKLKKENNILNILTLIFLFLLPVSGITFFHNHITTLIIVLFISLIFLLTLLFLPESRKNSKYLFLYYIMIFIYLLITYYRSTNFVSLIPNEYNIIKELLTMIKLIMPITFLYSLYYQKLKKEDYIFIIKSWTLIIAGLIILTNICKIGLSSYSDELIKYNIFEWKRGLYYIYTACKGYFTYANQVSVILLSLLLIFSYFTIYQNKKNIIYVFIIAIAMIMLGTRVSSLGGLLTLISILLFYFFYCFFKKEKISSSSLLILIPIIMWIIILPITPFENRNVELNELQIYSKENVLALANDEVKKEINLSEKYNYVLENYNPNYLPKVFFEEYYPIKYDEDFWYHFVKNTPVKEMNYRLIESSIIKRMIEINDNNLDILFGISNSRIQNVINLERDFVLHYYAYGIIGLIVLLIVYILLIVYSIYVFFKYQTFKYFIFTSIILLFIFSSFLTGNIINSLFPSLSFIFIISPIIKGKMVD